MCCGGGGLANPRNPGDKGKDLFDLQQNKVRILVLTDRHKCNFQCTSNTSCLPTRKGPSVKRNSFGMAVYKVWEDQRNMCILATSGFPC